MEMRVADYALSILVSIFMPHHLDFTFKLCTALECLISPLTILDTAMRIF